MPPGAVTRPISRSPATGSAMKCTTSWASAASNERVGERQLLGEGLLDPDLRQPLPHRADERRRRVDRGDRTGAEPAHELGRQRAGAAADVEHALAVADAGEVGELRRERHRVAAHEAVVGIGGDVEAHR